MNAIMNGLAAKIAERHGIAAPDFGGDDADDHSNAGESRHLESGCQVAPSDEPGDDDVNTSKSMQHFVRALALRQLTPEDVRRVSTLPPWQVDHIKWAKSDALARVRRVDAGLSPNTLAETHRRLLDWKTALGKPIPGDLRLRHGETLNDDDLDLVFARALHIQAITPEQAIEPGTLTPKQLEGVQWALLYTLGHARRRARDAEAQAEDAVDVDAFMAELAAM